MTTADEQAIRSLVAAFIDSWNRHDMATLAALFTEDADFVDVFGNWFKDRMAIERALARRRATVFKESRFAEKEVLIRIHKPDLAIVHAIIELSGAVDRQGQPLPPGHGVITSVIEKVSDGWRIIALQNTAVVAQPPPAT